MICSIEGCPNPVRARGWCAAHWGRWSRHGDPLGGRADPSLLVHVHDDLAFIDLGDGTFAIADAEDAAMLCQHVWHRDTAGRVGVGYARTTGGVYMHRMIAPYEPTTDHANRNTLDNRRANLRPANESLQGINRNPTAANTSGMVGVRRTRSGRWEARIAHRGVERSSTHDTREDAVRARLAMAAEAESVERVTVIR